jgi:hypothetical protein
MIDALMYGMMPSAATAPLIERAAGEHVVETDQRAGAAADCSAKEALQRMRVDAGSGMCDATRATKSSDSV